MSYNFTAPRQRGRSKKQAPPAEPQRKPVHIRSGRNVYEIGVASTPEEIHAVIEAYGETLLKQVDPFTIPQTYPKVTKAHRHTDGVRDQPQCYYLNLNTYALQHITRTGVSSGDWEAPTPPATWEKIDAHIKARRRKAPKHNFCEHSYGADGWWFDIHVYVDGFYPPCDDMARRSSCQGVLHAKAVAAEPPRVPVSITDTDPVRLWTAFFEAHPDAEDYVYVDRYLFQRTLTLCIADVEEFVDWVMQGQSLSRADTFDRYIPGDYDSGHFRHILPFTPRQCPRALRPHWVEPRGWVYIMSIEGSPHYKIGYCVCTPKYRRDQLQVGVPHRLTLEGAYATTRAKAPQLEWFVHQLLREARQGKTEWFAVDLATAQQACRTAIQQEGDKRYFWTTEQWMEYDERVADYEAEEGPYYDDAGHAWQPEIWGRRCPYGCEE